MKACIGLVVLAMFGLSSCGGKDDVVALIDGNAVKTGVIEERIRQMPPAYQEYLATEGGKRQFLDLLVRERVVLHAARKAGMDRRDEYRRAIDEFRKEQERRNRDYEENLLMELYVRELHDKEIKPTDEEVEAYYREHRGEFSRPVEITARHILLATEAEAGKALARVRAGENFAAVAKAISADPVSAARGGEIDPFKKGDLVPEFEAAVFPLKTGQVSGIVKTSFGYHIIKKTRERVLPARSLENAKAEIQRIVEKTKFDQWVEKRKNTYGVTVDYNALSRIKVPATPDAAGREPGVVPAQGT